LYNVKLMLKTISKELKEHVPFTIMGAFVGVLMIFILKNLSQKTELSIFYILHPAHVLLSAVVTASMYRLHKKDKANKIFGFVQVFIVGYLGSVGIATLSDSVIPFLGEVLLNLPNREIHIGFIEEWKIVNSLAIVGIIIGYFSPHTKFPHAGHVLISTWASLFHMLMALGVVSSFSTYAGIFIFLFLSVWAPCCLSDIVFPLLFANKDS